MIYLSSYSSHQCSLAILLKSVVSCTGEQPIWVSSRRKKNSNLSFGKLPLEDRAGASSLPLEGSLARARAIAEVLALVGVVTDSLNPDSVATLGSVNRNDPVLPARASKTGSGGAVDSGQVGVLVVGALASTAASNHANGSGDSTRDSAGIDGPEPTRSLRLAIGTEHEGRVGASIVARGVVVVSNELARASNGLNRVGTRVGASGGGSGDRSGSRSGGRGGLGSRGRDNIGGGGRGECRDGSCESGTEKC
jgi:hypothetical protein